MKVQCGSSHSLTLSSACATMSMFSGASKWAISRNLPLLPDAMTSLLNTERLFLLGQQLLDAV